jgi:hypothetical protein
MSELTPMHNAVLKLINERPRSAGELIGILLPTPAPPNFFRKVDRVLQSLRRADLITFDNKNWRIVR